MNLLALINPISTLLDKWIPDADERQKLAHELATMAEQHAQARALGQIETNKAEAQHRSLWVAGWRPAVGWVCAAALGWHYLGAPVLLFVAALAGLTLPPLPVFEMDTLLTVLLGLLGLGGLRTVEKKKGVTK